MKNKGQRDRTRLLLLAAVNLVGLAAFYAYLVLNSEHQLQAVLQQAGDVQLERIQIEKRLRRAGEIQSQLQSATQRIAAYESSMPSGDLYRWMWRTLQTVQGTNRVQIDQIVGPRVQPAEMLPRVPNESARFNVTGRAAYRELGAFVAALENTHPFLRLHNLELEPVAQDDPDRAYDNSLRFQMELSVLTRSAPARVSPGAPDIQEQAPAGRPVMKKGG